MPKFFVIFFFRFIYLFKWPNHLIISRYLNKITLNIENEPSLERVQLIGIKKALN